MHVRPPAAALFASAIAVASGLFVTGCQVAPLPEGYSWNVRHVNDLDHPSALGARHRRGLDANGTDRTTASTNRGGRAYNFASALPGRTTTSTGQAAPAPAPAADLSPPRLHPVEGQGLGSSSVPANLFADDDPALALFGSPVAAPAGLEVQLAPTPATGRNPGVAFHTVVRGDNLWSLAKRYYGSGLRYQDLLRANPGIDPENLKLGDRLVLPGLRPAGN